MPENRCAENPNALFNRAHHPTFKDETTLACPECGSTLACPECGSTKILMVGSSLRDCTSYTICETCGFLVFKK